MNLTVVSDADLQHVSPSVGAGRNGVRLVALDMDGTILEQGSVIPAETVAAIRECCAAGITIVTASGRPRDFQVAALERHGLDRGSFAALICDERELWLFNNTSREGPRFEPFAAWNAPTHARWDRLARAALEWVEWSLAQARFRGWPARHHFSAEETAVRGLGVVALESEAEAVQLAAILGPRLAIDAPQLACNRNRRLVQIHDALVDKARSLVALADVFGIDAEHVLAIGDSDNDRTMLDGTYGFRSATVANATPTVKSAVARAAGTVSDKPAGSGVAVILRDLVHGR